jgi:hypothetical protein
MISRPAILAWNSQRKACNGTGVPVANQRHFFDSTMVSAPATGSESKRPPAQETAHQDVPQNTPYSNYNPKASPLSPIYKAEDEDRYHVMGCADTRKAKWRHQLIGSVQKRCSETKTREMLTTILTDGITQCGSTINYAPFQQLIQHQNSIGWCQLFEGRFASKWQRLQNQHLWTNLNYISHHAPMESLL